MELDIMWKSRIENKVLLRQMGAGLVDTKRVLINNGKIKWVPSKTNPADEPSRIFGHSTLYDELKVLHGREA